MSAKAPAPFPPPRSIFVLKPSSLGDVVHTLPAVAKLKTAWPQARLHWLVNPEWAPLLEGNSHVDEIALFPRRELGNPLKQIAWVRRERARRRCDLVLDFQGLLRTALIGRACHGGAFFGLSDAREGARFFYDDAAKVEPSQHAVERYLRLVAFLGIDPGAPLQWPLPEGEPPRGAMPEEPFLLLHPFSRGRGKSLSVEEARQFCEAFPFPIVLAGRAQAQTGPLDRLPNVLNYLNATSLKELLWLLRRARFVVSVDSGPMHIAAALKKPLLSHHTWSDPARVGPYDPEAWIYRDRLLFRQRDLAPGAPAKPLTAPDWAAVAAFVAGRFEAPGKGRFTQPPGSYNLGA